MNRVETLLRAEIGLDAASLGPTAVERAAQARMKLLGLKTVDDYHRLLEASPAERTELVESVVVTETWFFRERHAFTAFTQLAKQWLGNNPAAPLRSLSVPCSSGEEPYTLAMCLINANIPPARFVIDAVDVSERTLARAILGVYGKNSFRGEDLAFRDRHFEHGKMGFTLRQKIRDSVRFQQDNLLSNMFLAEREPYHFIFCRNVLIYFDRPTQAKVLATLIGKLAKDGVLFVGPAEMPIFLDNGFVSAGLPMAFACVHRDSATPRRAERRPRATASDGAPTDRSRRREKAERTETQNPPPHVGGYQQQVASPAAAPPATNGDETSGLEIAHQLADAGKLKEAATFCEEHIRRNGPGAQVYYLLGLVLDARGDETRAADYYRKALYLDPGHFESLWHMALLLEKAGDHTEAASFKRRAQKVQKKAEG